MMNLGLIAADAAADAAIILSTWLVAQLSRDGANLHALLTEPSLRALTIAFALWLGLWAARWLKSGDPTPPLPVTPSDHRPPSPPA